VKSTGALLVAKRVALSALTGAAVHRALLGRAALNSAAEGSATTRTRELGAQVIESKWYMTLIVLHYTWYYHVIII
jgi:hypothetical protein